MAVFLGPDAKTASQSNPSSDHGIWVEEHTGQGISGIGLKKKLLKSQRISVRIWKNRKMYKDNTSAALLFGFVFLQLVQEAV